MINIVMVASLGSCRTRNAPGVLFQYAAESVLIEKAFQPRTVGAWRRRSLRSAEIPHGMVLGGLGFSADHQQS
jgi:hypothetical protein